MFALSSDQAASGSILSFTFRPGERRGDRAQADGFMSSHAPQERKTRQKF
jgi:hypothetical protein